MQSFLLNFFDKKLIWSVLALAAITLLLFLRFIFFSVFKKLKEKRIITFNKWILIGVFISAILLFIKVCQPSDGLFTKISQSAVDALRMFTLELRLPELLEIFFPKGAEQADSIYLSFFALLAPSCTVIAAVSLFFNDWLVQAKYLLPFRKAFVLSGLNENSLCLAKNIRNNHPSSMIFFTGVRKNDAENDVSDLLGQVKEINARTTKKSVTDFHFLRSKKTHIYLIDTEEKDNVKNGKTLFEKYCKKNIIINVFSTLKSAEAFINDIKKDDAEAVINLIDPAQIIAYTLLMEKPMFKAADDCGSDTMSVLVVGAGHIGMECAKAAMWCGVMNTLKFKIRIVDRANRESQFDSEIAGFKNNMKRVGCDFDYRFYKADVNDKWFMQLLENFRDTNYIIVDVGDDEWTINIYKKIRRFYLRRAIDSECYSPEKEPVIIPIVRGEVYNKLIKESENEKLYFAGCNTDIYKEKVIDEWAVEKFAEAIHKHYKNQDGQSNENDYKSITQTKKRSSRACAVHALYKLRDMGIRLELIDKGAENDGLTKEELDSFLHSSENASKFTALSATEHNRWCVFQLLDGWTGINLDDIKNVNSFRCEEDIKREGLHRLVSAGMHATIVENSELERVGIELYGNPNEFTENNENVLKFLGSEMITAMEQAYNKKDVKITILNEGENDELHSESD